MDAELTGVQDEWITLTEAAVRFDCPAVAIYSFARSGLLDKVPCEATSRPIEHRNQRFFLRARQVEALLKARRPAVRAGEWLSWPAAAAYLNMTDTRLKLAAARGDLQTASWIEIPPDQRLRRRMTYVSRSELDRFSAARYRNRALLIAIAPKRTDLAYAAGFFDGEGCVTLLRDKRGAGSHFGLRAAVANTDQAILLWLGELFGGHVHSRRRDSVAWKIGYCWTVSASTAYQFLFLIRPYVRVKLPQVDLCLDFYRRLIEYDAWTRSRSGIGADELEWRIQQARRLHELNRKGPPPPP